MLAVRDLSDKKRSAAPRCIFISDKAPLLVFQMLHRTCYDAHCAKMPTVIPSCEVIWYTITRNTCMQQPLATN